MQPLPERPSPEPTESSEAPGLPGLHSWSAVYAFVVLTFVLWVVLLTILGRVYS